MGKPVIRNNAPTDAELGVERPGGRTLPPCVQDQFRAQSAPHKGQGQHLVQSLPVPGYPPAITAVLSTPGVPLSRVHTHAYTPAPAGLNKDRAAQAVARSQTSVPDYGPCSTAEGAPRNGSAEAHATVPEDWASHADHARSGQLFHEEDITASFHTGAAHAAHAGEQASPGTQAQAQAVRKVGRPQDAGAGRGHSSSARAMTNTPTPSEGGGARVITPFAGTTQDRQPNPQLVMSTDMRYHSSFPVLPAQSAPVSPRGLIPIDPLLHAGHRLEESISAAGALALALSRRVLAHVRSTRARSAPAGAYTVQDGGPRTEPYTTTARSDTASVNSPLTESQKATPHTSAWAAQKAQKAEGEEGKAHKGSSTDDFGQEASGTAYIGPAAGQAAGCGAGVGAPDIPTRPALHSPYAVTQAARDAGRMARERPRSAEDLMTEGPDASSPSPTAMHAARRWGTTLAMGSPGPPSGRGLVGSDRRGRGYASVASGDTAAVRGVQPQRSGSAYSYPLARGPDGPWAPFAMDGGPSTLEGLRLTGAFMRQERPLSAQGSPFAYGAVQGKEPEYPVTDIEEVPAPTESREAPKPLRVTVSAAGIPEGIPDDVLGPGHPLDLRVLADDSLLRLALGRGRGRPSANGAWPAWASSSTEHGWRGPSGTGGRSTVPFDRAASAAPAPLRTLYRDVDGAEPPTAATSPVAVPALQLDMHTKAGTASFQNGPDIVGRPAPMHRSVGYMAPGPGTGDCATDGVAFDPPAWVSRASTAAHPPPPAPALVDASTQPLPLEDVEDPTLRVLAREVGREELMQPYGEQGGEEEAKDGSARIIDEEFPQREQMQVQVQETHGASRREFERMLVMADARPPAATDPDVEEQASTTTINPASDAAHAFPGRLEPDSIAQDLVPCAADPADPGAGAGLAFMDSQPAPDALAMDAVQAAAAGSDDCREWRAVAAAAEALEGAHANAHANEGDGWQPVLTSDGGFHPPPRPVVDTAWRPVWFVGGKYEYAPLPHEEALDREMPLDTASTSEIPPYPGHRDKDSKEAVSVSTPSWSQAGPHTLVRHSSTHAHTGPSRAHHLAEHEGESGSGEVSRQTREPMEEAQWEADWEARAAVFAESRRDNGPQPVEGSARVRSHERDSQEATPLHVTGTGTVFDYGDLPSDAAAGTASVNPTQGQVGGLRAPLSRAPPYPVRHMRVYTPGSWPHPTVTGSCAPESIASAHKPGTAEAGAGEGDEGAPALPLPRSWSTGIGVGPGASTVEAIVATQPGAGKGGLNRPHQPTGGLNRRYTATAGGAAPSLSISFCKGGLLAALTGHTYALWQGRVGTRGASSSTKHPYPGLLFPATRLSYTNPDEEEVHAPRPSLCVLPATRLSYPPGALEDVEAGPQDVKDALQASAAERALEKEVGAWVQGAMDMTTPQSQGRSGPSQVGQRRGFSAAAAPSPSQATVYTAERQAGTRHRTGHVYASELGMAPSESMFASEIPMTSEEEAFAEAEISRVHDASLGGSDPNYEAPEWKVVDEGLTFTDEVENAVPVTELHPREGGGGSPIDVRAAHGGSVPDPASAGLGPAITHHGVRAESAHPPGQGQVRAMCTLCVHAHMKHTRCTASTGVPGARQGGRAAGTAADAQSHQRTHAHHESPLTQAVMTPDAPLVEYTGRAPSRTEIREETQRWDMGPGSAKQRVSAPVSPFQSWPPAPTEDGPLVPPSWAPNVSTRVAPLAPQISSGAYEGKNTVVSGFTGTGNSIFSQHARSHAARIVDLEDENPPLRSHQAMAAAAAEQSLDQQPGAYKTPDEPLYEGGMVDFGPAPSIPAPPDPLSVPQSSSGDGDGRRKSAASSAGAAASSVASSGDGRESGSVVDYGPAGMGGRAPAGYTIFNVDSMSGLGQQGLAPPSYSPDQSPYATDTLAGAALGLATGAVQGAAGLATTAARSGVGIAASAASVAAQVLAAGLAAASSAAAATGTQKMQSQQRPLDIEDVYDAPRPFEDVQPTHPQMVRRQHEEADEETPRPRDRINYPPLDSE